MPDFVNELRVATGSVWPNLARSRARSLEQLETLATALKPFEVPDTSIVVFGSLARLEFTPESDIDWTLLLDGFSSPEHLDTAIAIGRKLAELENKKPGREGTFGTLAASHDLIHHIGGENDTNSNTTRRTLLLLESRSLLNQEAYDRVRNNLLKRYLQEDLGLWRDSNTFKIPHFMLNDFARYWRTMTVDFAYKQRARSNEGFALRNIKLRMSRKLIYISGLLACLDCHLRHDPSKHQAIYRRENATQVVGEIRETFDLPPLDVFSKSLLNYPALHESAKRFMCAYDDFLGILWDKNKRDQLSALTPEELEKSEVYRDARAVTHRFKDSVAEIFLSQGNALSDLTIKFGVF
jgi:predicted nucleotidyltransferase